MPNRVVHFEVQAKDLERAQKFYSEAFGWEMENMGDEYNKYIVLNTGKPMDPKDYGINGGMVPADDKNWNAFSCVISVDDVKKAVEDVKKAGGTVLNEPMDIPNVGTYAQCKDTEGNYFSVLQPDLSGMEGPKPE
jgi:uncharacterized protein